MYKAEEIINGVREPRSIVREINRRTFSLIKRKMISQDNFLLEDWDNLIILDATRFDFFQEVWDPRHVDFRYSLGSNSKEFIERNLDGGRADDVVWITANPFVSDYKDMIFKVLDVWDYGWSEELQTVPPDVMVDEALKVGNDHNDKRIIIHFMQPHYPFIGSWAKKELSGQSGFTGGGIIKEQKESDVWAKARKGEVNLEKVIKAYKENLELVVPKAKKVASELEGKSVITSDHGNLLGERGAPIPMRHFGHPHGLFYEDLIKVPWVELDFENRRYINKGELNTSSDEEKNRNMRSRLEALGYT
jgi:hypothetical protein